MLKLLEMLYPSHARCAACGEERILSEGPCLCLDCQAACDENRIMGEACPRCGYPLGSAGCDYCREGKAQGILWMASVFTYQDPVKALIHRFKFNGRGQPGEYLAEQMAKAWMSAPHPPATACTYVPMTRYRQGQRGGNHGGMLCGWFSEKAGLEMQVLLERNHEGPAQATLNAQERQQGIVSSFKGALETRGQRVLLIDDVITTGGTARSCAQALMEAEAECVMVLSAARTVKKQGFQGQG